jgi:hypothetical protein
MAQCRATSADFPVIEFPTGTELPLRYYAPRNTLSA